MDEQQSIYKTKSYIHSRLFYILKNAFEYFTALTVAQPFLTYLMTDLGMTDSSIGIISSIISVACLFQLISIGIVNKIKNRKLFSITSHAIGQFSFAAMFLVPVLSLPKAFAVIFLILGYFGNYLVSAMIYKWGFSFVSPDSRGHFGAENEMVSLISGMALQLGTAFIFNQYRNAGNNSGCYLFFTIMLSCFGLVDVICLSLMKKENINGLAASSDRSVIGVLRIIFRGKDFRRVLLLGCIWNISMYSSKGFIGTYQLKELGMSVAFVQVINAISCFGRFIFSLPIGAFADKRSYRESMNSAYFVTLLSLVCLLFTTPSTWFLIIAYSLLFNVSLAGTESNLVFILYGTVEEKYISQALAIKNALCGITGFLSSILCSMILSAIQKHGGLSLFGMNLYGQQVLAAVSIVFVIFSMMLNRKRKHS